MAGDSAYRLSIDSELREHRLTVAPRLTGPAGRGLRYEIVSTKTGPAGRSDTTQSGHVALESDGSARLSTLTLGVGDSDRYDVAVRVFEGSRLVAEGILRYPPP